MDKPVVMPKRGARTNIRPAGAHENKARKRDLRKLLLALARGDYDRV